MYKNKSVCVVVPAFNEEKQIKKVLDGIPSFVDNIVVIDDKSTDKTVSVVSHYQTTDNRVKLIQHSKNQGVGSAIASGYEWCKNSNIDIAVVMAGDGQMDPDDLPAILEPVATETVDYAKGNRLSTGEAHKHIPKIRFLGNSILSMLTKIASGYYHVTDSQTGYTAINSKALQSINWSEMYKGYGQPNDLLVRLNVNNFKVKDVPIRAVYNVGEQSGIKIRKVTFSISYLLIKLFFWRLKEKYYFRDFHPLIFFYCLSIILMTITALLSIRLFYYWYLIGSVPQMTALSILFTSTISMQTGCFAMWLDSDYNKNLR